MSSFSKFSSTMAVSLTIGLAVLVYGLYSFFSQWAYSENFHEYLFLAYVVFAGLVFLCLRMSKNLFALIFIVCAVITLFYANQKFEWRESYVQAAERGQYFPMEQYMDAYPTYEEHYFSWATGTPKWVAFSKECYEPLLNKQDEDLSTGLVGRNCKNTDTIMDNYGVDVVSIIRNHHSKMQNTARQLEKGRLDKKHKFEACIMEKKCAMIPLLPAGVQIEQQSKEYLDVRRQFWSLVNDKRITPDNCNFFDFCRVMVGAGIVKFDRL